MHTTSPSRCPAAASSIAASSSWSSHIRCRAAWYFPRLLAIASAAGLAVIRSRSRLASSCAVAEVIDEGENSLAADFEGDVAIRLILSIGGGRLEPQQHAP